MENPPPPPPQEETPVRTLKTRKFEAQLPQIIAVHPSVSNIINTLERENAESKKEIESIENKIQQNNRAVKVLKIAEVSRNGGDITAELTLINENKAISIPQPPIEVERF